MKFIISTILLLLNLQFCLAQCNCNDSTTFVDLSNESRPKDFKNTSELIYNKLILGDEFNNSRIILFFEFTVDCSGNAIDFEYSDRGMKDSLLFNSIKDIVMDTKWTPGKIDNKDVCERRRHSIHSNSSEFTISSYLFGFESPNRLYKK